MTPEPRQHEQVVIPPAPRPSWFRRLTSVLFIIFCLELGLFLMIYPWTDSWSGNYFSWIGPIGVQPRWHQLWISGYARGAITGLGLLNIWVAVAEALRMYIGNDRSE
jgi:hypothetical protein